MGKPAGSCKNTTGTAISGNCSIPSKAVIICDSMTIGQESLLMTPQQEEPNAGGVSTLEEMERNMIRQAIRLHESNMSAVAAQLGITRQTLYNKIKKYGL